MNAFCLSNNRFQKKNTPTSTIKSHISSCTKLFKHIKSLNESFSNPSNKNTPISVSLNSPIHTTKYIQFYRNPRSTYIFSKLNEIILIQYALLTSDDYKNATIPVKIKI